jgi:hypothetical protein
MRQFGGCCVAWLERTLTNPAKCCPICKTGVVLAALLQYGEFLSDPRKGVDRLVEVPGFVRG